MAKPDHQRNDAVCAIFAKTERTITQTEDLHQRLEAFFNSKPHEIYSELNGGGTQEVWRFRLARKLPFEIPIIVGEILHNLRSPLDQILCAIALTHSGTEEGVGFPRGRTKDEFNRAISKQAKLLPPDAITLITRAKPYRDRGNKLLWALLEMNRRDKHRVGLVPIQMPAELSVSYLCFWVGLGLVIGSRNGKHLVMEKAYDPDRLIFTGKPHALYDARPGRIAFDDLGKTWNDDLEFLTTTPGAKFDADFQMTIDIAFDEAGIRGQPVVTVLSDMRELVQRLLLAFEKQLL